ncbi:unnamed protein product [Cladocopium goreaui]|uniref:Transmembrane protein n=1 Tax=Cladocopium goreaui TaxID=2562237 RepID=A0A9P1FK21_9DINO|nr:unnamed protein product [Cladocopium goreaui]
MGRTVLSLYIAGCLLGGLSGGVCIPLFTSSAGWICGGVLGTTVSGGLSGGWLGISLEKIWAKMNEGVLCLWLFFLAFVVFLYFMWHCPDCKTANSRAIGPACSCLSVPPVPSAEPVAF